MSSSPTTGSPGIVPCPSSDQAPSGAAAPSVTAALLPICVYSFLMRIAGQYSPAFFTYHPAKWNPPQGSLYWLGSLCGGGFPAHENARPHQGGPGIFMCGCRGGITHYTLPSARCAPGDTPGPRMRHCPCLKSGLRRRFCRLACTVPVAAKTPPTGRGRWTKDEG